MSLGRDLSRLDILNLEWPSSDRDLHIVTPALVYLQKKYHLAFKTKSIFLGYYYLLKYRPKVLLVSNFAGAGVNHEIVKLAYKMGIKVISMISEGNVKPEAKEQFLWGNNKDKFLYIDRFLLWSERSRKIFLTDYPQYESSMITTGATGFDRYKLLQFKSKKSFLTQEKLLQFQKVIGIAAWGFDHYFGQYFEDHKEHYLSVFGKDQIDMYRQDLFKLQSIYQTLIENNPDTLFILRYHPGTIDFEKNEFFGLDQYENVFISSKEKNRHYKISDLINISDLWLGYETTTALESWLLAKQTFLINPTRSDFVRENVHRGSPIVKTAAEAQELINEYFANGTIKRFEELEHERKKIIKDVIEYGDGKNHQRAAEEIMKVLNEPDKNVNYGYTVYKEAAKQLLKLFLSKTIMKNRWPKLHYKNDFAKPYQEMYNKAIDV